MLCPSVPKENCWPPNDLPAHSPPIQECPRLLWCYSWLPHIFFMTLIPSACVEWKSVTREGKQRLGALRDHAVGFGVFLVMFLEDLLSSFLPLECMLYHKPQGTANPLQVWAATTLLHTAQIQEGWATEKKLLFNAMWKCFTTIYLIFQESKSKTQFEAVSCLQRGELCRNQEVLRVAEAETLIQTTEYKGKFKEPEPFNKKLVFM